MYLIEFVDAIFANFLNPFEFARFVRFQNPHGHRATNKSIQDFGLNLGFLMSGGKISDLSGKYPSGEDGLEVTKIAEAVHQSIERGGELIKILQEK